MSIPRESLFHTLLRTGAGFLADPNLPPTIEERIVDNRAQTVADSVMYRDALAAAAAFAATGHPALRPTAG